MVQAVDDAAFAVKTVCNHIEKLVVAGFILPPQGIRNQISVLDEASRLGINKKGHIYQIMHCPPPPPIAKGSEIGRQGLQTSFLC